LPAYRLSELAELVGGSVQGDPDRKIEAVRTLDTAGPQDLSFLTNPRYRRQSASSGAGALLVGRDDRELDKDLVVVDNPSLALGKVLDLFASEHPPSPGVHPTAIVSEDVEIASSASVGPYAVVGEQCSVGERAVFHAHVVVGRRCVIGPDVILHPRVVLYDGCEIRARSILHAGVVVGSDGFGYTLHQGNHVKLPHIGRVVVEEDVEIGANTTIDRGLVEETRIGSGSKIDNLVQVAHNVRLGQSCLLVSQVGISGSTRLGDGVVMAGQSGAAGHLELEDGVQVAGKSAVFKSVQAGEQVAGIPAVAAGRWRRQQALVQRIAELFRRLKTIESNLQRSDRDTNSE